MHSSCRRRPVPSVFLDQLNNKWNLTQDETTSRLHTNQPQKRNFIHGCYQ